MAADLDPILVRALALLHSRHPKSLEQLCALRDEALGKKPEILLEVKKEETKEIKKEIIKKQPSEIVKNEKQKGNGKMVEKTIVEEEKESIVVEVDSSSYSPNRSFKEEELLETVEELASSIHETVEELDSSSLLLPKKKKPKLLDLSATKTLIEGPRSHESSPEHEIVSDMAIQCSICLSGKTNLQGNQLVECHDCHEHYHQNCHTPSITDQNINDPRHVWYCSLCIKRMKEATTSTTSSTTKQKSVPTSNVAFKPQSFKPSVRVDGKPPSFSPGSTTVTQSFSIPSLTSANNTTATTSTCSIAAPLKSPNNANPRDVARNSMKRLQMVKKKAAAKNQQRFTKR